MSKNSEAIKYIYNQVPYLKNMDKENMTESEKLLNEMINFFEQGARHGDVKLKDMLIVFDLEHFKIAVKALNIFCEKDLYEIPKTHSIIDGCKEKYNVKSYELSN